MNKFKQLIKSHKLFIKIVIIASAILLALGMVITLPRALDINSKIEYAYTTYSVKDERTGQYNLNYIEAVIHEDYKNELLTDESFVEVVSALSDPTFDYASSKDDIEKIGNEIFGPGDIFSKENGNYIPGLDINDKTFAEIFDKLYKDVNNYNQAALDNYIDFQMTRQVNKVSNQLEAFDNVIFANDENEKSNYYAIGDSTKIPFDNILSNDGMLKEETKGTDGFYSNGSNLSDDHFVYYDINTYFPEGSTIWETLNGYDQWHPEQTFDLDGYLVGWNFAKYPTFPTEANKELWIPDNHNGKPVIGIEPTSFLTHNQCEYIPENGYDGKKHGFYELGGIEYLYIPNSIIGIGRNAFKGCRSIEYICFGTGLKWLGLDCFAICQGLKQIVFESTTPPITAAEVVDLGYYDKKYMDDIEYMLPLEKVNILLVNRLNFVVIDIK